MAQKKRPRRFSPALILFFTVILFILAAGCASKQPATAPTPMGSPATHVSRGERMMNQGDLDAALAAFQAAVRMAPAYAPAYTGIARVQAKQDRKGDALKSVRIAIEHAANPSQEISALLAKMEILTVSGPAPDIVGIENAFTRIQEMDPGETRSALARAEAYSLAGKDIGSPEPALKNNPRADATESPVPPEKAIPDPAKIRPLMERVSAQIAAGELLIPEKENAWLTYREILSHDGNNPEALKGIGNIAKLYIKMAEGAAAEKNFVLADDLLDWLTSVPHGVFSVDGVSEWIDQTRQSYQQEKTEYAAFARKAERVVAPEGGDHSLIQDALDAAESGAVILIRPGTYRESLTIAREVHLVGFGPRDGIIIESTGDHVFHFKAEKGTIKNVTLRLLSDEALSPATDAAAVNIAGRGLLLEGCDITSEIGTVIIIQGNANPTVRGNRIHGGKETGVYIRDNGMGLFEDNEIFGNTLAGIEVRSGGNPVVRDNIIRDGKQSGVFIHDDGKGLFENNDIFGNTFAGIAVTTNANPTVRGNRVNDGEKSGIFVYDNGRGLIEDNDIFGNRLAGIEVRSGGNPVVRGNTIRDGQQSGVFTHDNARGVFENNDILGNVSAGISVTTNANPIVRGNRIHDGERSGIFVYDNGRGEFEHNDIFGNAYAGVAVRTNANPMFRGNTIREGRSVGVFVYDSGNGLFEKNEIFGNAFAGMEVRTGANPRVRGNRIHYGKQSGIFVHEDGIGVFENNDIFGNAFAGITVREHANPVVRENRIHGGKQGGVFVHDNGRGVFEGNQIFGNAGSGIVVKTGGNPTVWKNRIYQNEHWAIRVYRRGRGNYEGNDLAGNSRGAWSVIEDFHVSRTNNRE